MQADLPALLTLLLSLVPFFLNNSSKMSHTSNKEPQEKWVKGII